MSRKPSIRQLRDADSLRRLSTSTASTSTAMGRAWFDGSALPNPGKIGIGVLLILPSGERHVHSIKTTHNGCNNEAELHALIATMELALAGNCTRLIVHGDSQVAIRYVTGEEHTKIVRLSALIAEAQQLRSRFDELHLTWVPRHRNIEADRLSRAALGLGAESLSSHP